MSLLIKCDKCWETYSYLPENFRVDVVHLHLKEPYDRLSNKAPDTHLCTTCHQELIYWVGHDG